MYNSKTNVSQAVILEREQVLEEEWFWAETYGDEISIYLNTENSVLRDKYNSLSQQNTKGASAPPVITLKAYPIIFGPTKYQMEKAGIQEQSTVIVTVPLKYWTIAGYDVDDLYAIKGTIVLRGETYSISDKSLQRQIADSFTSINIGLFRK